MTAHHTSARYGLALAALLIASAAGAEETVVALSPAAKEKLLDAAAARRQSDIGEPAINGLSKQIHGEVGMFVGTGGARGVFGSMVAPVGDSGSIALAFENSRFGRRY
ncbi:hypothetical protein O4H52_00170 [Sphingomonadaceae bacterium G21617-S1]|jgi:hypothetical protein|uniref:hypothetical protein n=1 Tax=Rhizorhabdus sp. TaxID=1968843 RepID=UPI0012282070|nr:hypothetical protein [Rhizorhabdus sp.]MBD3760613.1 hypothetical protein [Rhizorhabdus sp.]MCZ4340000.1 hypothetical protein [Sphingomonadaceae bacterium G21617-S1]TAK11442.1 MAG: hypothetical protein EPO38_06875 [Rhizorhabdus sp.]